MTTITALPTPPTRQDPINFADRADAFLAALPTFATETNTVASEVNDKYLAVINADIIAENLRGQWVTATAYALKDVYTDNGIAYLVVVAHTSTSIANDAANGKVKVWQGVLFSDLAATAGSSLVGHTPIGAGAVPTTLQAVVRETLSVSLAFPPGYVTDGSVDYTTQINIAVSAANVLGAKLHGVAGTYKVTGTGLPINSPLTFDMRGMILKNSAGNVLRVSGTGINLSDGKLWSAGGGSTVLQTGPIDQCSWQGMQIQQDATGYSLWDNAGFDYVDMRHENFNYWHVLGATVPGFKLVAAGGLINDNTWTKGRVNNSGAWFFDLQSTTANWQYSNSWSTITFEVCRGGGIRLQGAMLFNIEDCQNWDCGAGTIVNHFYSIQLNAFNFGSMGSIKNCGRWDGGNSVGIYDIQLPTGGGGAGITIENCVTSGGGDPFIADLRNNGVVCTIPSFTLFSTVNSAGRTVISGDSGGVQFPGTVNGAFLSYYDEGTWTASLQGTTAEPTVPVTIQARWTRVGREVLLEGVFGGVDMTGATGALQITGMPFPVGAVGATGTVGLLQGAIAAICIVSPGATTISIVNAFSIGSGIAVLATPGIYVYFSLRHTV